MTETIYPNTQIERGRIYYGPGMDNPDPIAKGGKDTELWGKDGFGFDDFIDLINPLQHLPIVGTLYRSITGDTLEPGARLIGGALFGGPVGLALAMVNTAVEQETGGDVGANLVAMASGKDLQQPTTDKTAQVALVQNKGLQGATQTTDSKKPPTSDVGDFSQNSNRRKNTASPVIASFLPAQTALTGGRKNQTLSAIKQSTLSPLHGTGISEAQKQAALKAATSRTKNLSPDAFNALMQSLGATNLDAPKQATNQFRNRGDINANLPQLKSSNSLSGPNRSKQVDHLPTFKKDVALELHHLLKNHRGDPKK